MPRMFGAVAMCVSMAVGSMACDEDRQPVVCTAIAVSSLVVTVRDAETRQRVCDATVTAMQAGTTYSLRAVGDAASCTYSGPEEKPGLFEVHAARAGYEPASMSNVRVNADECHVIPVHLTLDLRQSP